MSVYIFIETDVAKETVIPVVCCGNDDHFRRLAAQVPAVVALQVLGVAPACDHSQQTAALSVMAALSFVQNLVVSRPHI